MYDVFFDIRAFFVGVYELIIPKAWRFKCPECEDKGWVGYEDRIGFRSFHTIDRCRACLAALKAKEAGDA